MKRTDTDPNKPDAHPDAWQRFEKAVDVALHTKPLHRPPSQKKKPKKAKKETPKQEA